MLSEREPAHVTTRPALQTFLLAISGLTWLGATRVKNNFLKSSVAESA